MSTPNTSSNAVPAINPFDSPVTVVVSPEGEIIAKYRVNGKTGRADSRVILVASQEGEIVAQYWLDPGSMIPTILMYPRWPSQTIRFLFGINHGAKKWVVGKTQKKLFLRIKVNMCSVDERDMWSLHDARGKCIGSSMLMSTPQSSPTSLTSIQNLEPSKDTDPSTTQKETCTTCRQKREVKRCACGEAAYCSTDCQSKHWKGHCEDKGAHKEECAWQQMHCEFRYQHPLLPPWLLTLNEILESHVSHPGIASEKTCNFCGQRKEVKCCACREAAYCSSVCQLKHWKGDRKGTKTHKKECSWQRLRCE